MLQLLSMSAAYTHGQIVDAELTNQSARFACKSCSSEDGRVFCSRYCKPFSFSKNWPSKFVQEVANSEAKVYPIRTLYGIICGIRRDLEETVGSEALRWLETVSSTF